MTSARRSVAVCLLVLVSGCGARTSTTSGTRSSAPASSPALPSVAATIPDGYPAEAFRVAAPMVFFPVSGGPLPPDLPVCTAAQVVAKATTIRTVDGVDGVIRLDGPSCNLDIRQGPTNLLDAAGHQLAITLYPVPPAVNPPTNRGDFALAVGHVLWGFAVDGSWCGAAPAFMVLPLTTNVATAQVTDLRVPLTGPAPPCTGRSDAELRPGVSGATASSAGTAEAVLPAPQEWAGLHLTLHVDSVTKSGALVGLSATISNPTGSPVSLSPCPTYQLVVTEGNGEGAVDGTFGCSEPRVLAAGESVTYPVDDQHSGEGNVGILRGGAVEIELAIAGLPTATATAQIG